MQTQKKQNTNFSGLRSGFTLVELLIVITIIVLLMASALRGIVNSQRTFIFNATSQTVTSMVREARSLAVTGKAQLDYTDYDNDGCYDDVITPSDPSCAPAADYVTPANYGVFFDNVKKVATLFADLHGSGTEGVYNPPPAATPPGKFVAGSDLIISVYPIPSTYSFILSPGATTTVMYSPIFADTTFNAALGGGDLFFVFGVKETGVVNPASRCFAIHPIAGTPETTDATGTGPLCI